MSTRAWLNSLLGLWLVLSTTRLAFDLVGKLWIPVTFDLLQVVCCITGLFGVIQKRNSLLASLLVSNFLSIAQNVLLFLWYVGIFGDISRPVLSAGLPYSFSFFLRYTPGCQSHFDLKRTMWVQHQCFIPFYIFESSQAILHMVMAMSVTLLAIVLLCEKTTKGSVKAPSQTSYGNVPPKVTGNPPSSINDGSYGYMNSTYDDLGRQERQEEIVRAVPEGKYERNSKRKKGKVRPNSMPLPEEVPPVEEMYTAPMKRKRPEATGSVHSEDSSSSQKENLRTTPATVKSLVSFDPKSATLLRIRAHLETVNNDYDYADGGLYERIRSRASSEENNVVIDIRAKNASQDSVPSMLAPMLASPNESSVDSGTSSAEWNGPGIRLVESKQRGISPGIKLSDAVGTGKKYKSAFRVQAKESRVIGHYHSPKELPLSSAPSTVPEQFPVIDGQGLLV